MGRNNVIALIPLLLFAAPCHSQPPCAGTIRDLREMVGDPVFPLEWRETSMSDGNPLVLSIVERASGLFVSVVKQNDGLWAEGSSAICAEGDALEVRFVPGSVSVGANAHWAVRYSLSIDARFTLLRVGTTAMRIGTLGWAGMFAPR